jgi:hypothetical protein
MKNDKKKLKSYDSFYFCVVVFSFLILLFNFFQHRFLFIRKIKF